MGFCNSFVKYSLFLINFLFTILGLAIIIAAIVIYLKYHEVYESMFVAYENGLVENGFQWLAISIIVLGFAIFIISLFGCWGSVTENKCLLALYATMLLTLIGGKLFIVIKFHNFDEVKTPIKDYLEEKFDSKTDNATFHLVEYALHCCGTSGPTSYHRAIIYLPPSCCADKITDITKLPDELTKISKQIEATNTRKLDDLFLLSDCSLLTKHTKSGCINEVIKNIDTNGNIIIEAMIVTIAVEIIETAAVVYLCIAKNQKNKKAYY